MFILRLDLVDFVEKHDLQTFPTCCTAHTAILDGGLDDRCFLWHEEIIDETLTRRRVSVPAKRSDQKQQKKSLLWCETKNLCALSVCRRAVDKPSMYTRTR